MSQLDDSANTVDARFDPEFPDGRGYCALTGVLCEIRQSGRLKLPWPSELAFRYGSRYYLRGMEIYHDFEWIHIFRHDNRTFPGGSYLATHAYGKCPAESQPALLLTTRTEIQEVSYLQSAGRFVVVVNINDYLRHTRSNPAVSFIASPLGSRLGWLASLEENDLEALRATDPKSFSVFTKLARRCVAKEKATPEDVQAAVESLPEIDHVSIDAILQTLLKRGTDTEVILQRLMAVSRSDDLSDVLEWLVGGGNVDIVQQLSKLEGDSLGKLNAVSNVVALRRLLQFWEKNQGNSSEQFWQEALGNNLAVLSQVFAFPIVVIQEQAYVGGKRLDNTGGSITDFLCKNARTGNVAIIEIKTPATHLLASPYRGNTYNIGSEVSGAVVQVASQRDRLIKRCFEFQSESNATVNMFSPKCVVLVGNSKELLNEKDRIQSFELYRNALTGIEVLTFDELFGRAQLFIEALGSTTVAPEGAS